VPVTCVISDIDMRIQNKYMYLHAFTYFFVFLHKIFLNMKSFKANIYKQIDTIPEGKIFTFGDLSFSQPKFAYVAVILSNLTKENKLKRIEKGAYYKPKHSSLDLGVLPVYQDEKLVVSQIV